MKAAQQLYAEALWELVRADHAMRDLHARLLRDLPEDGNTRLVALDAIADIGHRIEHAKAACELAIAGPDFCAGIRGNIAGASPRQKNRGTLRAWLAARHEYGRLLHAHQETPTLVACALLLLDPAALVLARWGGRSKARGPRQIAARWIAARAIQPAQGSAWWQFQESPAGEGSIFEQWPDRASHERNTRGGRAQA